MSCDLRTSGRARGAIFLGVFGSLACATTPAIPSPAPVDPARSPAYCADLAAFRAEALREFPDPIVQATLARWHPPAPVPEPDKDVMYDVARLYVKRCALAEVVALTRELVAFPTVSAEASAPDHPAFGAMAERLQSFAADSKLGFSVYGAHDAWEIVLGDGPPMLGFVMHADVVPVREMVEGSTLTPAFSEIAMHPSDWTRPPFRAQIDEGRLYGRGTEDDKGPIAAVLVVMRSLARLGLVPRGRVLAILGTGEETDWSGMKRYVEAKRPPLHVISVDASFPVVIAEAGFVAWTLGIARSESDRVASSVGPKIVDAHGGQFLTQVPGQATMDIIPKAGQTFDALAEQLEPIVAQAVIARGKPFAAEVSRGKERVRVTARGKPVHSSTADEGHNPLWLLADIAGALHPAPSAVSKMLEMIEAKLAGEHDGTKLGVSYVHPMMGSLLVTPTLFRSDDKAVTVSINMRRPAGRSKEEFDAALDRALGELKTQVDPRIAELSPRYVGDAAIAELEGPLVPTLMDIWTRATGTPAKPTSIRGGTYARLFPGAVSFGPSFPNEPYRGHTADEYIELEALAKTTELVFEATIRLADGARAP